MKTAFCALALTLVLAGTARAGAIFETVDGAPGSAQKSTTLISTQDGKLAIEHRPAGQEAAQDEMIFKDDTLLIINHKRKTYSLMDKAAMQRMSQQVNDAMKQMEERLAGLPPEQRAMMEKMMGKNAGGGAARPVVEFRKTARTERTGEHECRVWEGVAAGQTRLEYCVVPYASIIGSAEFMQTMKKFAELTREMMDSINNRYVQDSLRGEWEGLKAIDGYPVLLRTFRDGRAEWESTLKSSRVAPVPAKKFEIPAGYKKQDMMEGA